MTKHFKMGNSRTWVSRQQVCCIGSGNILQLFPLDGSCDRTRASGRLNNGIPMVPRRRSPSELDSFRRSLPVHERQKEIIQLIRENKVVLVMGETGSGKTTQVGLSDRRANTLVPTETPPHLPDTLRWNFVQSLFPEDKPFADHSGKPQPYFVFRPN